MSAVSPLRVLYVMIVAAAFAGCGGTTSVMPGSPASGHVTPQSLETASPAPSLAPTPTSGTLYYAGMSTVYAIPLTANGASTATRSITPHPNRNGNSIAGLATNADGTLDVLETYLTTGTNSLCQVVVEAADANGSPGATNVPCETVATGTYVRGLGIARNALGGFDLLFDDGHSNFLNRYAGDGASLQNTLTPAAPVLATDRGGHDYLARSGEIYKYKSSQTDWTMPVADCIQSAPYGSSSLAVTRDGTTIYLTVAGAGGMQPTIYALTGCGTSGAPTVLRQIGPFTNFRVSALAVDSAGQLYVALSPNGAGNAVIRVYASDANNGAATKPTPVRIIYPSPALNVITALAIYE